MLRIRAFGTLEVTIDETSITAELSSTQKALLFYLAWTGCPQERSHLAEMLWPERPAARSLSNLRTVLSQLRNKIGVSIQSTRTCVWLDTSDNVWFDAAVVYETLSSFAERRVHDHATENNLSQMESTLSLCALPLLEGFSHIDSLHWEEWLDGVRQTVESQITRALTHLAEHYYKQQHFGRAAHFLRRLVQFAPYDEDVYAKLMTALTLTGQPGRALNVYDNYCAMLQNDFVDLCPGDELTLLAKRIRKGELQSKRRPIVPSEPVTKISHSCGLPSLPQMLKPLLARETEIQTLIDHVRSGHRLISVVGMGGIGKTHLLKAALRHLRHFFGDGVYYVDLSSVPVDAIGNDADEAQRHLARAMAAALGILFTPENAEVIEDVEIAQILDFLAQSQLCMVLDNFETVIQAAPLVARILSESTVTLITGTRMRLKLSNEVLLPIEGLPLPPMDGIGNLEDYGAIALFVKAAQRTAPHFQLTETNAGALVRISHQVGGLPLALEIAGAWIEHFSAEEISQRIEESVAFLATSALDLPQRQRRLDELLAQSALLLTPEEIKMLSSLSVFASPFPRAAALSVSGAALSTLVELVNKQWVQTTEVGRYFLHPLIKQFVQERLASQDKARAYDIERAHARYFADYASKLTVSDHEPQDETHLYEVRNVHNDLCVALVWLIEHDTAEALDLICALAEYWEHFGILSEAANWLTQCLHRYNTSDARLASALSIAAHWLRCQPNLSQLEPWIERSVALLNHFGSPVELADLCRQLGWYTFNRQPHPWQQRGQRSVLYLEQTVSLCRLLDRNEDAIEGLLDQALMQLWTPNFGDAQAILDEVEARAAPDMQPRQRATLYHRRAALAYFKRQYATAWSFTETAWEWALHAKLGEDMLAWLHKLSADIAWFLGQYDDAARHAHAADTTFRRQDQRAALADLAFRLGMIAHQSGNPTTAANHFVECIALSRGTYLFGNLGAGFTGVGLSLLRQGQVETGARLIGYGARRLHEDSGALLPWDEECALHVLTEAQEEVRNLQLELLIEEGKRISACYAFDLISLSHRGCNRQALHSTDNPRREMSLEHRHKTKRRRKRADPQKHHSLQGG